MNQTQREPLEMLAWYRVIGWARRRARLNIARRRMPFVIVHHPAYGYAQVREASLSRYALDGATVVERIDG